MTFTDFLPLIVNGGFGVLFLGMGIGQTLNNLAH